MKSKSLNRRNSQTDIFSKKNLSVSGLPPYCCSPLWATQLSFSWDMGYRPRVCSRLISLRCTLWAALASLSPYVRLCRPKGCGMAQRQCWFAFPPECLTPEGCLWKTNSEIPINFFPNAYYWFSYVIGEYPIQNLREWHDKRIPYLNLSWRGHTLFQNDFVGKGEYQP